MKTWQQITHYGALDWARNHHCLVIVNGAGKIVADFQFEDSLKGWKLFGEKTSAWPNRAQASLRAPAVLLGYAIEPSRCVLRADLVRD